MDWELKRFGSLEIKSEEQGAVEAVVATLGVIDRDGDVILPGAVGPSGARVKLSGYGHDVVVHDAAPVGKGLITEADGRLVLQGKFFLSTQRGREAFATLKELGPDAEWSIGFPPPGTADLTDEWRAKGARRLIAEIRPVEASPVLVAAGVGTGTLAVKAQRPTASVDGRPHPAEDFAYVPDPEKPSTWKLPIFDADHVRNALARLDQADIPASAMPEVRRRIAAAARRFGIDAASLEKSWTAGYALYRWHETEIAR